MAVWTVAHANKKQSLLPFGEANPATVLCIDFSILTSFIRPSICCGSLLSSEAVHQLFQQVS